MPRQEHVNRTHPDESRKAEMDELVDQAVAEAVEEAEASTIVEEADAWLDDIDEALDEWAATSELAAEFVKNYVQKGGQ